jgi:hypothetical protein
MSMSRKAGSLAEYPKNAQGGRRDFFHQFTADLLAVLAQTFQLAAVADDRTGREILHLAVEKEGLYQRVKRVELGVFHRGTLPSCCNAGISGAKRGEKHPPDMAIIVENRLNTLGLGIKKRRRWDLNP